MGVNLTRGIGLPRASGRARGPKLAVLFALVFFVWRAFRWSSTGDEAFWLTLAIPAVLVAATSLLLLGLLAIGHRFGGPSPLRAAPWALSILLMTAAPFPASWNDGCNDHSGQVATIALGIVAASKPAAAPWPYEDGSTLVLCLPA